MSAGGTGLNKIDSFPKMLAPGLWVLGNYYFNLYLVKGEQGTAIVEAGVSAVVDDVIAQLQSLKLSPTFLVVTHPHADHVTGLPGLKEKYPQLLVVAGEGTPEFLNHSKAAEAIITEDKHMAAFLNSQGIMPGRLPLDELPTLENCLIAADGDEMDLGDMMLRYVSVKGHAPGEIVIHIPEIRSLILSDCLGFRYPGRGVFPLFFTGYSDYLSTLDQLQSLNPDIIGPAHQGPVFGEDVEQAFEEARREAILLRKQIVSDPRTTEQVAKDIFEKYYRDELRIYTAENIMKCARLLVKRARE